MLRPQSQPAPNEQEGHEHRQRVEVDLVAEHAAGRESRAAADDEGDGQADRDRQVHPHLAAPQPGARFTEDRRSRKQQHRNAQQPRRPLQQPQHVGRDRAGRGHVRRRCVHHHLHHAEGGDEQAPQRRAFLAQAQCARRLGQIGHRPVACALDSGHASRQPRRICSPANGGAARCITDIGADDARLAAQCSLDKPSARGAVQAREPQVRGADALAPGSGRPRREAGLRRRVVERRGGASGCGLWFHSAIYGRATRAALIRVKASSIPRRACGTPLARRCAPR